MVYKVAITADSSLHQSKIGRGLFGGKVKYRKDIKIERNKEKGIA
jgi:hypothetical protein